MTPEERIEELKEALASVFDLIERGVLVRDTSKDQDLIAFSRQCVELTVTLRNASQVIDRNK